MILYKVHCIQLREREDDLTKLKQDLSVKEEVHAVSHTYINDPSSVFELHVRTSILQKENQDPEHYPSLKQQIKDICRLVHKVCS